MEDNAQGDRYRTFMEAYVQWPPEMPDNMLEDVIKTTKEAVRQNDPEQNGHEVARFIK